MLLAASYFVTYTVVKNRAAIRTILWLFVICTGFKSLQASYMFFSFARAMNPRPESLLSHEESVFFGILMVLTVGLWVYGQRGLLRIVATALLPFVIIATMANARRTAWPIVMIGLLALLLITWVTQPSKRRAVGPVLVLLAVISAVYFPLYWNKTGGGTLSQPARAVRSTVAPDPRRRAVEPVSRAGERQPGAQHPASRAPRQRLRPADQLRVADRRREQLRPDDQVHPAQRWTVDLDAPRAARRDRVLDHVGHRVHRRMPLDSVEWTRRSPCSER